MYIAKGSLWLLCGEQSCGNKGRIKETCQETNQVTDARGDGGLHKSGNNGSGQILGKCSGQNQQDYLVDWTGMAMDPQRRVWPTHQRSPPWGTWAWKDEQRSAGGRSGAKPSRQKEEFLLSYHPRSDQQPRLQGILAVSSPLPTTFCVWLFLILKNETFSLNLTSSERTSLDHFILIPPPVFLPPPISLLFFFISQLTVHWHTPIYLLERVGFSVELCGRNSNSCPHQICHLRAVSAPL